MWTIGKTSRFVVSLLALSWAIGLWGQVVGANISGVVTDASGAPIPGVEVTVTDVETGAQHKLSSDEAGRYSIPSVPVGRYQITASKENFKSQTRTAVELVVGQRAVVNFALSVGDVAQTVTVEASAAPVELTTDPTSGLVSERQVKDLPLNGRSFDGLITLNPGVVNYTSGRSGGVGTSDSSLGNMFAVSGRRPQENLFLLNGIEYTGASLINITPGGASGELLGVDAVREFNVVTDTYGAEYGKRPGGQVSIVTASGTNQLHGSVYDFLRNSDLDARNFFDQGAIPHFARNVFGGALGGPLKKNKLFLFGNYEGYRQHLGLSDVTLVPDNAARASAVPAVVPLLSLWPVANGPDLGSGIAEAFSHPLQTVREDFGTTRLDYNISNNDTFFAAYTIDDSADNTPSSNPLSLAIETIREQVLSAEEQHVFSPTILNTARVGYSRASFFFTGTTPVDLPGWVAGQPIGAIVVGGGTALNAASQLAPAGTNAGSNLSAVRNLFTYDDHAVFTHGAHQIEVGFWLQQIQANDNLAQDQYGQASFSSLSTFLKGTIGTFTVVPTPTPLSWRSVEGAGFVQDAIKLRKNLDLRLGFRFESTNGWNEAHDRASNYVFSGGVIQTDPVIGHSVFTDNRAKFLPEPRVGLAWDPFGKGKTVITSGFGIYRALLDDIDYRLDQSAPFNTTESLKNVPLDGLLITPGTPLPAGAKISPSGIQPDAYTPTVLSWSLRVAQQIAPNTSLTVGYVGSHGYHELLSLDANIPNPTILPNGTIYFPTGAPLMNPALTNTTTWMTEGLSSYNALQIDLNRRFRHGFQIRGVYTYAKSLDDGTALNSSVGSNAPGFVMYPLNPKLDWGPSTSDVRNSAVINGSWELPLGKGRRWLGNGGRWTGILASGWTLSGIETLQSGLPFTPSLGYNPANDGDSRDPVRPSYNPAFSGPIVLGGPNQYFNPNAFLPPAAGTYGNVGRDTLYGPGIAELDFSALKNFNVTERMRLQFRAEFFNILNRANLGTPNTVVYTSATSGPSPTAGLITSTSTTSRQIQFGLKLLW
ncbi:MAG TPA: carboxypeptidase-like regulatory domain-containing protein [Bryobacteraceae bacterium]|nr:carboxypeptidase-like regulatory domain-containing protein [Bryobacteraceae bacterium]